MGVEQSDVWSSIEEGLDADDDKATSTLFSVGSNVEVL